MPEHAVKELHGRSLRQPHAETSEECIQQAKDSLAFTPPNRFSAASPPPLTRKTILQLQRTIGNHSVRRLLHSDTRTLQRQITDEQAEAALQRYRTRRSEYPSTLIRRIQVHFGIEPTGSMDIETVRAIARWQEAQERGPRPTMSRDPVLVDGILTPEEMLEIVATGMERRGERSAYVEGAGDIAERWTELGTAERRLEQFAPLINSRLRANGVPECEPIFVDDDLPPRVIARFEPELWHMRVSRPILEQTAMPGNLAGLLYHEARHAEQAFLALRYNAQSRAILGFAREPAYDVPQPVADAAQESPTLTPSEEHQGRMFEHSWFREASGEEPATTDSGMDTTIEEFCAARRSGDSARMQAMEAEFQEQHGSYEERWHERDAHFIEALITEEYGREHPGASDFEQDPCEVLERQRSHSGTP